MNALTIARRAVLSVAISLASLTVVAGTLHVHTSAAEGFNTHSVWYDDGQEVTVVDAQFTPAFANTLLATIKRQTASPVTRVIVTHPSPDKFNGLSAFHTIGAQSIASVATAAAIPGVDAYKRYYWTEIAKIFTAENYPKIEPIKTTFTDHMTTVVSGYAKEGYIAIAPQIFDRVERNNNLHLPATGCAGFYLELEHAL